MVIKKYWFTLAGSHEKVTEAIVDVQKKFKLSSINWGSGPRGRREVDFYVLSKEKLRQIRKYIKLGRTGILFITYPNKK